MAHPLTSTDAASDAPPVRQTGTARNVLRFLLTRVAALALALVTAVYLTILIVNYGGYVDTIVAARIEEQVGFMLRGGWLAELPPDERMAQAEQTIATLQDAAGLNDPFVLRSARWLGDGLTLNWGAPERAQVYGLNAAGKSVGAVIADNLSQTLLVFGLANVLLFGVAVASGLLLNRRYGGFLDRAFVLLTPISSAPAWVYGVLLSAILLRVFGFTPGGTFDVWPGDLRLTSVMVTLRHLLLPFIAIFLAGFFKSAYTWRNYFLIYSSEEYVNLASAKGLSKGRVDRNYIMRPALPALLTSFALLLAVLWQEVIALEYFFNVQGIGYLFVRALSVYDTPMIVAIVTTFAYLLAITLLVLDICYVFFDPRVRVGSQEQDTALRQGGRRFWQRGRSAARRTRRFALPHVDFAAITAVVRRTASAITETLRAMRRYPAAIAGLLIIAALVIVAVFTVITIPYQEAVALWRGDGGVWNRHPRAALPAWVNALRRDDLPPTLRFGSTGDPDAKQVTQLSEGMTDVEMAFAFAYDYGDFPQDIIVDITAVYVERGPHVTITWVRPDGSEQELTSFQPRQTDTYYVSRDKRLQRRLRSEFPQEALFLDADGSAERPLPGTYTLRVNALLFEPDSDVDVDVTLLGQVFGLAGTDSERRDLMLALLWGTPVALTFGIVAAVAISVGGMLLAALGAWYGGTVDRIVQYLTEVNLILPAFAVSLMVFTLYSRSIVTILLVTIALTLFGSAVKTYRATFLQVRAAPYIEAAQAYGAGNWRIVTRYMIPRIFSVLVPTLIILVPTFVFLEATLAFLGVSDPHLPTWGKLVVAALSYGVNASAAHIVIAPFGLLFLTGFAFAMVGLTLERILEPRLRDV